MGKLFYKAIIGDIQNNKCTDQELENLLDIFEYTIRYMATTLARKSWYELKDYATAKQRGIDRFTLVLEKRIICDQEQYWGIFEHGNRKLKVIGTLSKD